MHAVISASRLVRSHPHQHMRGIHTVPIFTSYVHDTLAMGWSLHSGPVEEAIERGHTGCVDNDDVIHSFVRVCKLACSHARRLSIRVLSACGFTCAAA